MKTKSQNLLKMLFVAVMSMSLIVAFAVMKVNTVNAEALSLDVNGTPVSVSLTLNDGASIRFSETDSGMRFSSSISKADYDALVSAYGANKVEVGSIIAPKNIADSVGELTFAAFDAASAVYIRGEAESLVLKGENYDFNIVLNTAAKNFERSISARSYVAVTVDSNEYIVYTSNTVTRSTAGVANMALTDIATVYESDELATLYNYSDGGKIFASAWSDSNSGRTVVYSAGEEGNTETSALQVRYVNVDNAGVSGGEAQLLSQYNRFFTSDEFIRAAYARGAKYLKFSVKADAAYFNDINKITIFNANGPSTDGYYGAFSLAAADTWQEYVIDIERFLALPASANKLAFAISGMDRSCVYFKDFSTEATADDYLACINVFDKHNSWSVATTNVSVSYSLDDYAVKLYSGASGGINGRHYASFMPISDIQAAHEAGLKGLLFSVKCDAGFLTLDGAGLRIIGTNEAKLYEVAMVNESEGVRVYGDITATTVPALTTEYKQYLIDLDDLFDGSETLNYFGFVIAGRAGFNAYVKDAKFLNAADFAVENSKIEAEIIQNYDVFADVGNWSLVAGAPTAKAFDADESALKITTSGNDGLAGRWYAAYYPIAILRSALANGYAGISIQIKANATMLATANGGLRFYGKNSSVIDDTAITDTSDSKAYGVYFYKDVTVSELSTDYVTVYIDLANFLAPAGLVEGKPVNYFAFVVSGDSGSEIYLKDMTFLTSEQMPD